MSGKSFACITKAFLDFFIYLEMFHCINLLQAPLSIQEGVGIGASYKSCKKSMVVGKVSEDRKQAIVEHILGMKETLVLLGCLIQIGGANIYKGRCSISL